MDDLTLTLAKKLCLCSEVLGRAAEKAPCIAELHRLRLAILEAIELGDRFPSFGSRAMVEILKGC